MCIAGSTFVSETNKMAAEYVPGVTIHYIDIVFGSKWNSYNAVMVSLYIGRFPGPAFPQYNNFFLFKDAWINSVGFKFIWFSKICMSFSSFNVFSFSSHDFLHVELLCNDQVFFEILKMKIRSVSITYSIRKSRDEKEKKP
jgi:hypothetical protein